MKKILWIFPVIFFAACAPLQAEQKKPPQVTDFASCVAAGNPALKTFPPRCMTRDGQVFIHDEMKKIDGRICRDQCGDGVCQQIVCKAEGCPCAETPMNCPKDCVAPEL